MASSVVISHCILFTQCAGERTQGEAYGGGVANQFLVDERVSSVLKLDWSDVAKPTLMTLKGVVGGAGGTAINNGRVYVATGTGGMVVWK